MPFGVCTRVGPRNYVLDWVHIPRRQRHFWRRVMSGFSRRTPFPVGLTSGFPCMLSTIIWIRCLQMQSGVTSIFFLWKILTPRCGLSSEFFDHVLLFCHLHLWKYFAYLLHLTVSIKFSIQHAADSGTHLATVSLKYLVATNTPCGFRAVSTWVSK